MPIFTYTPQWDAIQAFYSKFEKLIPETYEGFIAIRLHRTGNPLTLEFFGPNRPEDVLYPIILLELRNGDLIASWDKIKDAFDVPWTSDQAFHRYRNDVMRFYHAEDLLEPAAEVVLAEKRPSEETLRKAIVDHAALRR
jgi:hypothetical protein